MRWAAAARQHHDDGSNIKVFTGDGSDSKIFNDDDYNEEGRKTLLHMPGKPGQEMKSRECRIAWRQCNTRDTVGRNLWYKNKRSFYYFFNPGNPGDHVEERVSGFTLPRRANCRIVTGTA